MKIKGEALTRVSYFYKDVESPAEKIANGSIVQILSALGHPLGWGLYNGHARTRLRVLSHDPEISIDDHFFESRLKAALELRRQLNIDSNACRLVNAEGDGLPGLIVDKFDDLFVIEYFASGMFKRRNLIKAVIQSCFSNAQFYSFSQRHVQKQESFDHYEEPLPAPREVIENGIRYRVRPGTGHKTGFFLDQRENRKRFGELAAGKSVLDLCCHAGGFSLSAKKHGALSVTAIDRDPVAIEQAQENAGLNELSVDWQTIDIDSFLRQTNLASYDLIALDPPKQTKSREGLHGAMQRYLDWNTRALKLVKPNGVLVSCSCSGLVRETQFLDMLSEATRRAGRKTRVTRRSSAAADHPFSTLAPESQYLKVVWLEVI